MMSLIEEDGGFRSVSNEMKKAPRILGHKSSCRALLVVTASIHAAMFCFTL
jgi:hypothetical protein